MNSTMYILRQVASASIAAARAIVLRFSVCPASRARNQIASNTKGSRVVSTCALTQASKRSKGFQANARVARMRVVLEMVPYLRCRCPLIDQISNVDARCMDSPRARSAMTIGKMYAAPPKSEVSH